MKQFKLFFACALMSLFSLGQVWADEGSATVTFSELSIGNSTSVAGTAYSVGDYFTVTCTKNEASMNPTYYDTGTAIRCYATKSTNSGNIITISRTSDGVSASAYITKVTYSGTHSKKGTTSFAYSGTPTESDATSATYSAASEVTSASATLCETGGSANGQFYLTGVTVEYVYTPGSTPKCATPTFSPAAGSYEGTQNVTITSTTGATIYYTTDESDPKTSGTKQTYSAAIPVAADMTIKAYATLTSYDDSDVATAAYTITEGPDVTIAFEGNSDWNIPAGSGSKTVDEGTYTDGTYTIKIAGSTGEGYYINGYLLLGKTGAYVELPEFSNPVEKIVVVGTSGGSTGVKFNIYDGTTAVSTEVTGCKNVSQEFEIADPAANKAYKVQVTSNANLQISAIKIYYGAAPAVAKPTISGDENFVGSTTVTITHADADAIYYTTDGSDPKTSGTKQTYSVPFTVNADGTTTVKAYAVKGSDESDVASKTFTKVTPMTTAVALRSFATSSAQNAYVQLDGWKVTFVSGNNAYIIDPSNEGVILNNASHGYVAGDELNDEVVEASVKLASGRVQLSGFTSTNITATSGTVSPVDVTDFSTVLAANQSRLITLKNATYASSTGTFSDGEHLIYFYDQFSASPTLVDAATYDVTGVVIYYKNNTTDKVQIAPREATDVVSKGSVVIPTAANLAALKAASRGTYILTLTNAVVTYVNGNNAFIEDATGGALIYLASHGFTAGDCLNGDYQVTTTDHQGKFEITAIEPQAGAATTTAEIPLTTISIATLNANFGSYESMRVKIAGANVTGAISGSDRNGEINDGAAVAVYAAAGASIITLTADDNVDIIGYPGYYNTNQQFNVWQQSDITVNVKDDPELSYSPASVNLTVGDALSAPTFNNPHTLSPITYNTNNDAVATVDEYGAIALAGGTGTAVITASYAGDATYNAGNATFTINVYDPAAAPKNVVIIAEYNTKFYAMSTALNTTSNYCPAIEVEKDGGNIVVTSAEDKAAIQWSMAVDEGVSPKTASFQAGVDEYLKGTSGGAGLSFATTPFDWEWDDTNNCYIVSGSTRGFFYKNDGIFKNYALSNLNNAAYAGVEIIEIDPANIIISSKVSAELAYDPATLTITQGEVWSAPTLGYVVGFDGLAAITYASDNEAVATVTDAGVISLAGGTGTATITATFAGNANYLAGNATYAITVNAPAATPTGTTYTKVTSTAEITDGEYLIVYEGDGATHEAMAFNGSLDNVDQALKAIAVTIVGDEIAGNTDLDAATFTIDVAAGTLQSASGYYIGRTENSNGMEKDNVNTFTNTFAITDGKAVITSTGGPTLRYNYASDQLRFRYYKSGQQDIQLYKKVVPVVTPETVRTGLEINRYYTVCLPKKITSVTGGTFWTLTYKDAEPATMVYIEEATAPFAAGKPYIFQATATSLQVVYEGDATDVAGTNGALVGTLADLDAAALAAKEGTIYLLIQNALRPNDNNYLSANRAYIRYDLLTVGTPVPAPGKRVRTMPLQGQTITGIDELNTSETPVKMLINGQLFILRGEKMYDAQGRLVK